MESSPSFLFREVAPVRPAAPWIGGKRQLAARLVRLIEAVQHDLYAEPFVGMGGVFLTRRTAPKVEVVNDRSADVATFFRVLQRHFQAFVDMIRWQLSSRVEFERLRAQDPATLTDLERAARFLYLQRLGFGGKVAGRTFGMSSKDPARFNVTTLEPVLAALHERLAGVVIESLDFEPFLDRYDRPGALFYLDPPYWGSEGDYGRELFSRADFTRLAARLKAMKGHWILSINDTPETRDLFAWAEVASVRTVYTIGVGAQKEVGELVVRGGA